MGEPPGSRFQQLNVASAVPALNDAFDVVVRSPSPAGYWCDAHINGPRLVGPCGPIRSHSQHRRVSEEWTPEPVLLSSEELGSQKEPSMTTKSNPWMSGAEVCGDLDTVRSAKFD